VGWDSIVGIVAHYRLDGLGIENRQGTRFSTPIQTGPGSHPASYKMSTGSFPGVKKQPWHGIDHPPPSSSEVKEKVELYIYTPFGPSWSFLGRTLTKHLIHVTENWGSCHLLSTEVREE
jgi:hypothetical protein